MRQPGWVCHPLVSPQSYHGHVFWDQETWMFPPLLLLHPDIGRTILDTRKRTAVSAARNARYNGHSGLQYPWESAFTGKVLTPEMSTHPSFLAVSIPSLSDIFGEVYLISFWSCDVEDLPWPRNHPMWRTGVLEVSKKVCSLNR